jgi:hypothetical protein
MTKVQPITFYTHLRSATELLHAERRVGIPMDDKFGIEAATYDLFAQAGIDELKGRAELTTVLRVIDGTSQILCLVHGDDHPHIASLAEKKSGKNMQPIRGIDAATETKITTAIADGGVGRLLNATARFALSAEEKGLARKDHVARLAYACLHQVKIDHPALDETQAARLNLEDDFSSNGDVLSLRLWPVSAGAPARAERSTEAVVQARRSLMEAKKKAGFTNPLVFPTREQNFQNGNVQNNLQYRATSSVLNPYYANLKLFTGFSWTFQEMKDLVGRVWLIKGVSPLVVSKRCGYDNLRSFEQRHAAYFTAKGR